MYALNKLHTSLVLLLLGLLIANPSTAQKKVYRVFSADAGAASQMKLGFPVELTIVSERGGKPDSVIITSSNEDIVSLMYGRQESGKTDTALVHKYGVAAITLHSKYAPHIKRSFKIVVSKPNAALGNFSRVRHASIKAGQPTAVTELNYVENSSADFTKSLRSFYADDVYKNSTDVSVRWNVLPEKKTDKEEDVAEIFYANQDSCVVFFKKRGLHTVQLKAFSGGKSEVVGSYEMNVIGEDISEWSYNPYTGEFLPSGATKAEIISSAPSFIKDSKLFSSTGKYFVIDKFDNRVHPIKGRGNYMWLDSAVYEDPRWKNHKYFVRRLSDKQIWMLEDLKYIPSTAVTSKIEDATRIKRTTPYEGNVRKIAGEPRGFYSFLGLEESDANRPKFKPHPAQLSGLSEQTQYLCPPGWRVWSLVDFAKLYPATDATTYKKIIFKLNSSTGEYEALNEATPGGSTTPLVISRNPASLVGLVLNEQAPEAFPKTISNSTATQYLVQESRLSSDNTKIILLKVAKSNGALSVKTYDEGASDEHHKGYYPTRCIQLK